MTYLLLQTFLLLLSSYFLGAFVACLAKRLVGTDRQSELVPVRVAAPAVTAAAAAAALAQARAPVQVAVPRAIDPVQPKIDVLRRPEPKPMPKPVDYSRFERALIGPDPNAGMPRKPIAEIRPAILKSPTGPAQPWPPVKKPDPVAKPVEAAARPSLPPLPAPRPAVVVAPRPAGQPGSPQGTSAAAAAAAAAAVAAAKAAAVAASAVTPQLRTLTPNPAPAPVPAKPAPVTVQPAPAPPTAARPASPSSATPVTAAPPAKAVEATAPTPPTAKPAEATPPAASLSSTLAPEQPPSADDFQRIRAIDADTGRRLKDLGVTRFEDIAKWSAADVNRVNQALGLPGRIDREQWIEQAQILAKGGETYYSRNRATALRTATATAAPAQTAMPAASAPVAAPTPAPSTPAAATTPVAPVAAPPRAAPQSPPGRSVADMAAAAAAAIAAASASVTRGVRPIEPISPLSRADPNLRMPAKLSDAIKEREAKDTPPPAAASTLTPAPAKSDAPKKLDEDAEADDLKRIRGIGVLIEKRLNAMSIWTYDQIANWTSSDIDRVDQSLELRGRIEREKWVEQARILSSGGQTEFSRRVDKGEVESSQDD